MARREFSAMDRNRESRRHGGSTPVPRAHVSVRTASFSGVEFPGDLPALEVAISTIILTGPFKRGNRLYGGIQGGIDGALGVRAALTACLGGAAI